MKLGIYRILIIMLGHVPVYESDFFFENKKNIKTCVNILK